MKKDDMKSVVYLCCPVQDKNGWAFLTAMQTCLMKNNWDGDEMRRLLPARQLNFSDATMADIFEETHNLANWVVNYDELLDRRQLLNQRVRVIRYKQAATQGRNVIISSKAPLGLLRTMVLGRIKDLNLGLDDDTCRALTERFIEDANDISGDIVLRAAKNGRNASELMGIVLSRFLMRHELGNDRYYGWYFLDDYANWLGQREEQIADVLVLSPEQTNDGRWRLTMVVTESKYIEASGLAPERKKSQKQVRDTVTRINDALFDAPERLDRDLWLSRLSDLILDGVQIPATAPMNLADWRRAIREGTCDIEVRSYSHVFVSGPSGAAECSERVQIAGLANGYQEVFGRADVRRLVSSYLKHQDPTAIREEVGGGTLPGRPPYRAPIQSIAAVFVPVADPEERHDETDDGEQGGSGTPAKPITPIPPITPIAKTFNTSPDEDSEGPTGEVDITGDGVVVSMRWAYPGIEDILSADPGVSNQETEDNAWLREIEQRTKVAFQQYQMRSKLVSSTLTPNAALMKFAGGDTLTVEHVMKRRSQFLTTYGLNIVSVQPEPSIVSLAIERPTRQVVHLRDLWQRWRPDATNGNQELLIAVREDNGELLVLSPGSQAAPHTLIAGSTGSGKSVLLQNIILAVAATNTPAQARLILIDPKQGVDYYAFDGLPHLGSDGIIDDQDTALDRLRALAVEMDARYAMFKTARARDLAMYNRKMDASERLPVIWLIHDEFAEWMLTDDYKQEVTSIVSRLGVKARAAGIYLIFAAQRPDVNVMPMQLRANLGNRLILRVDSEGTSEVAWVIKVRNASLGRDTF